MNRSEQAPIPDHRLFGLIASGAYGEVWLGSNALGTLRAVKIVRRDQHTSLESFEREFKGLRKFEPVSRCHEGLVDILTLGLLTDGSGFYYVMELADNISAPTGTTAEPCSRVGSSPSETYRPRTLRADLKSRGALPAKEVIRLGLKITAALSHLHGQGLVHRDVKPSNILFVGGEPKLADAGLVAEVNDPRSLVGTAGYIAPEGPGTPQADLYALGKVLYEAAFGKDRQEFPALPADVAARPDHRQLLEVNEIIATASAHDPKRRYGSAQSMSAELALLGEGRSVKRRRAFRSSWKFAWRIALPICAVLGATGFTRWVWSGHLSRSAAEPGRLSFAWSTNGLAQEEYLRGMRLLHAEGDSGKAIEHFKRATELDPNFAEGFSRLAWAYYSEGGVSSGSGRNGQVAAEKAVSLNPNLAYAHSVLATAKALALDWAGAEQERQKAVKLNPNSQEILLESALNLAVMGRTNQALADLERARHADPESASKLRELFFGFVYAWCGHYEEAVEIYKRFPERAGALEAQTYFALNDYTNAMRIEKEAALAEGEPPEQVKKNAAALEDAFKTGGPKSYWELSLTLELPKTDSGHWVRLAAIYARLQRPDEAFHYLTLARDKTPMDFEVGLNTNPSFATLHGDWRFQAYLKELWRKK